MAYLYRSIFLAILILFSSVILARFPRLTPSIFKRNLFTTTMAAAPAVPRTDDEWKAALAALPATPEKIPAFYFGHGSPMLQAPEDMLIGRGPIGEYSGPNGPLGRFLKDFGPTLLEKYKPKAILVFSAHWETSGERVGESLRPLLKEPHLISIS